MFYFTKFIPDGLARQTDLIQQTLNPRNNYHRKNKTRQMKLSQKTAWQQGWRSRFKYTRRGSNQAETGRTSRENTQLNKNQRKLPVWRFGFICFVLHAQLTSAEVSAPDQQQRDGASSSVPKFSNNLSVGGEEGRPPYTTSPPTCERGFLQLMSTLPCTDQLANETGMCTSVVPVATRHGTGQDG